MKIRTGFVSNSSSSSFCLSLKGLTESQRQLLNKARIAHNQQSHDGYLSMTDNFLFGGLCNGMEDEILPLLDTFKLKRGTDYDIEG